MLTERQQQVFDWLHDKLDLPVFAEAYKGARIFLQNKPPGYVTFVAHAGRDLMNGLARTVSGINSEQVQYVNRLNKLQDMWTSEWGGQGIPTSNDERSHLIPYKICQGINELIEDHQRGRLRSSDLDTLFFSTFLDYRDKNRIPSNFLKNWIEGKKWFLKHAHVRKRNFGDTVSTEIQHHFKTLDDLLYVAASSAYERLGEINEILEETND